MAERPTCPRCGSELPARAPQGLCPRCLLREGLDGEALSLASGGVPAATVSLAAGPDGDSVLETLAASVGPVPRVLLRDTDPAEAPTPVVRPGSDAMPAPADHSARLRLLGEIARGGMGAVLKGRDEDLGRDLAVKVLLEKHRSNPELIRRFVEEAQIAGQLQHPGIAPVYELGAFVDRRPYFTMKLIKGRTLADLLRERAGPDRDLPRLLGIFEQVCQTMAYAHARGVIHRDLKPSNVMVGGFGEVQVMDWGLAKVLPKGGVVDDAAAGEVPDGEAVIATARSGVDPDAERSRAGSVLGTPAYMAPEQARGEVDRIDERTDVFALGSMLCEVLTGAPAFTGRSAGEIQGKAALGDTADALGRLDARGADADLASLVRDCLARERDERPHDAAAVARRVTAHLVGVQERLRDAERRRAVAEATAVEERKRRKLQLGLAASILTLATVAGLSLVSAMHRRQARAARVERLLAEATLLRDQARERPDDVARWERARDALARIADDLAAAAGPAELSPVDALRREVQAGREAAEVDRALLRRLVDIRSAHADDPGGATTDAAYADAFGTAGLGPDAGDPAEAGARIARRPEAVAGALVAALDHWSVVRRARDAKGPGWKRLLAAARAADPDPDRDALRAALLVEVESEQLRLLRRLAEQADAASWAPASLELLGVALAIAGDVDGGVAVLRRASGAHPGDAGVHYSLGWLLEWVRPPQPDEAIRAYAVARALQPELTAHRLAHVLEHRGRGVEAEEVWRDLTRRRPDNGHHLSCYAVHLKGRGRAAEAAPVLDRAIASLREAIRRRPDDVAAHNSLGVVLLEVALDYPAAEASFRAAIRLDPDNAKPHRNLGIALSRQGKLDEAIASLREAIRLEPRSAEAHTDLGVVLARQGETDAAIAAYREAIRLNPDYVLAHTNLSIELRKQGELDAAIAALREAIRLRPDYAEAHFNIGFALASQGELDAAIAAYREAVRLRPDYAEAHCNLGQALGILGDYAGSLNEYRTGHELGSKRPGWPHPSAEWVRQAEQRAALAERLPALLGGAAQPADNAERLAVARLSYDTKHFAAAARFMDEALEADPKLAADLGGAHRYDAACAAALAGCGKGQDEPPPDDAARAELRGRALEWLRADLALRAEQRRTDAAEARRALTHWTRDPDLAGVRDPDALAALPEDERADWQALWAEVDRLLQETGETP